MKSYTNTNSENLSFVTYKRSGRDNKRKQAGAELGKAQYKVG